MTSKVVPGIQDEKVTEDHGGLGVAVKDRMKGVVH